jgi:anti-sigma factor RsiW
MTEHITTDQLIDYLHRALSPADDARVLAHVGTCSACQAELEEESALTEALRAAAAAQSLELPPMLRARVWDAIRNEPKASLWPVWLRPAFAFPAAAIVAAATVLSLGMMQNNGPRITADYYLAQHASGRANPLSETPRQPAEPIEESEAQLPVSFASITSPFDAPESASAR